MIGNFSTGLRDAAGTLRTDGPAALWARTRLREQGEYEEWLEERDIICVIAALRRLSERQLNRLGMSHRTLALDVEDLIARAEADRLVGREVLELVSGDGDRMMAAE
jgi:hypothetical protein